MNNYTIDDLEFLLAGSVSLWGDGEISSLEMSSLKKRFKESSPDIGGGLVFYKDPRDESLKCKEYLLWVFETISVLKQECVNEKMTLRDAQESAVSSLAYAWKGKVDSLDEEGGERRTAIIAFLEEVADSDGGISAQERELIDVVVSGISISKPSIKWGGWVAAVIRKVSPESLK